MGLTISYVSTDVVAPNQADAIRSAAEQANRGRSWLSSEPVSFYAGLPEGKLMGGSKPNFAPQVDDRRSAESSALPDGGPRDVVEILSQLSRKYAVDWQLMLEFGSLG